MNFSNTSKTSYCQSKSSFCSEISNLFDFQRVGTPIINECTSVAVPCCHGRSSSCIPTSKVIRSCSYSHISFKTSNAFQSSISNEM